MSIFKESFKPFVQNQIKIRQTKVGQGDRTYFLQRQCTIRMASGVDIDGNSTTAKNNILEGGTKSNDTLRGGFASSYDSPKNGFGTIPMAGITSVKIQTKTAYGSLRQATVNFECHSTDQLSLLEKLYMRPGYPCLLEWGWAPYLTNDGNTESNLLYLSSNPKFWEGEYDQDTLQKAIIAKKETSDGNYDGIYGIIKDFNYSIRPDGGYTCRTELISIGEVLESIKPRLSQDDNTKSELEKTLEDLSEYALNLSEEGLSFGEKTQLGLTLGGGAGNAAGLLTSFTLLSDESIISAREAKQEEFKAKYPTLAPNIIAQNRSLDKDKTPSVWVRWGDLIPIMNDSFPKTKSKTDSNITEPIIEIVDENLEFNTNVIKDDLHKATNSTSGLEDVLTRQKNLSVSINPNICLFPSNVNKIYEGKISESSRKINDICFEVTYLLNTFRGQYYTKDEFDEQSFNDNFSIGKFIKKIWDDVNSSCGNGHNFNIINDFEKGHIIKVIDLNFKGENLKLSDLVSLNVLSTNSIVRDFNYDLSIPSALTATIAIAAQNPDDPESLEEVTFAAFNKGIRNRFIKPEVNEEKTWSDAAHTVAEKKFLKFRDLRLALEMYFARLNGPDQGTPSDLIDKENLDKVINYNETQDNDKFKIKLVGDPYTDFNEIPSSDLSSAKSALRYLNTARIDLESLTVGKGEKGLIGLPKTKKLDISSIIPLKFNVKLDGISGIVMGNVFKIDSSRLPDLYKDNKVAFIVMGEQQEINGQDWTTTITGQATILPI
jgi:hypothetical protein